MSNSKGHTINTDNTLHTVLTRVASVAVASLALLALTVPAQPLSAQDTTVPGTVAAPNGAVPAERTKNGYSIRETADLGGHIANIDGSGAMYDTLVNLHSGPRLLGQTFDLRALPNTKHFLFDTLSAFTSGIGGDPNNVGTLRFSKGKSHDFQGLFRRDRQYFDYNLLGNPLVPAGLISNGYTFPQLTDSPHMFNTVRRMTDLNLTILPVSKFSIRGGYSQNIAQGPTLSSVHEGADGLLLQNWRHSTDDYMIGADWKPVTETKLTYEERVVHYKGNTSYQMAPQALNLQLSNGTPVSLGYDNVTVPANSSATSPCGNRPPILSSATNPPTANSCENGFVQYTRLQPTRTIFPTEEFRFQTASIPRLHMNGRLSYTGANTNLPNYFEYFNGLLSRTALQSFTITGLARAQRINVDADFGTVIDISRRLSISEQYDHTDFRQSGLNTTSEVDQKSTSMLNAPGAPQPAIVSASTTMLGQKVETNTLTAAYEASDKVSLSLGYRYRGRMIRVMQAGETPYSLKINENTGLFHVDLRPTSQWRINGAFEASYADNAYVQIDPRQHYQYKVRTSYKPKDWAIFSCAYNDIERRDNVYLVSHRDHNRSFSLAASVNPNEFYGVDVSYAYTDVYTQTTECYYSTVAGTPVPSGTACGSNTILSYYYYDAPTEFGSASITLAPAKPVRTNIGFRVSGVNGNTVYDNPRQVPGALQSQYISPFANISWTVHPGWIWKGDWNYYGYGEDGAIGPTLPRAFHANVVTIAMHYEF